MRRFFIGVAAILASAIGFAHAQYYPRPYLSPQTVLGNPYSVSAPAQEIPLQTLLNDLSSDVLLTNTVLPSSVDLNNLPPQTVVGNPTATAGALQLYTFNTLFALDEEKASLPSGTIYGSYDPTNIPPYTIIGNIQTNAANVVPIQLTLAFLGPSLPGNFYFAASGNDSNNCSSKATACKTITRFNAYSFPATSTVNFNGGDTFSGGLVISVSGLTVQSYGTGQAEISSGNSTACVSATNIASVTINNLNCVGGGNTSNTTFGIAFVNNQSGNTSIAGPTITNNTVTGYGGNGIDIRGSSGTSGFNGVTISGNTVHDDTGNYDPPDAGSGANANNDTTACINIVSPANFNTAQAHSNVTITGNTIYNCTGYSTATDSATGSGIIVQETNTFLVSNNLIHDFGSENSHCGGASAMWTNTSLNGVIEFNEGYNGSAGVGSGCDGGGFDIDGEVFNTVMQYNYSHENASWEFSICGCTGSTPSSNNTVRFNIAEAVFNSGIDMADGILLFQGSLGGAAVGPFIYNNTIYQGAANGSPSACINENQESGSGIVANNICYNNSSSPHIVTASPTTKLTFAGNDYAGPTAFDISYEGTTYSSLSSFQSGTGQEKVSGSPVGTTAAPNVTSPGNGGNCGGYSTSCPANYELLSAGPAAGAGNGLNLTSDFSISPGNQDFFGTAITASTLPIGAVRKFAYQGLADILGSPTVYIATRAMDAALVGNKAINIIRASDSHTCDVLTTTTGLGNTANCSTGGDDGESVVTWCNGTTCSIDEWYDQTGNGNNLTQSTSADRPVLTFNCINGSLACATFNGTSDYMEASGCSISTLPMTIGELTQRTGNTSAAAIPYTPCQSTGGSGNASFFPNSANHLDCAYSGGSANIQTANDNVWHSPICQGPTSGNGDYVLDGVNNNGTNLGASVNTGEPASVGVNISSSGPVSSTYLTGTMTEMWGYSSAVTLSNIQALCHNQSAYYGAPAC